MKLNTRIEENGKPLTLSKNQVLSFKGRSVRIKCLSGTVWVTWPGARDKILSSGEILLINTKGKICMQAFSNARVVILKPEFQAVKGLMFIRERI